MDERRLTLLRDLERALLEALSDSVDVHRSLERMHGEGYTLALYLDCQPEGVASSPPVGAARKAGREPVFRINSDDLAMLRALGIDPTRKGRARR